MDKTNNNKNIKTADEIFNEFWKPLVMNSDRSINWDKVKSELFDYYNIINNTVKVYDHITGGKVQSPSINSSDVIDVVENHYIKKYGTENQKAPRSKVVEIFSLIGKRIPFITISKHNRLLEQMAGYYTSIQIAATQTFLELAYNIRQEIDDYMQPHKPQSAKQTFRRLSEFTEHRIKTLENLLKELTPDGR